MQILPIDITGLIATILGISIVLVPVIGLTARYALSPAVQALAAAFESRGSDETIRILERRIDLQEQEMAGLRLTLQSIEDANDFERKLSAPQALPPSTEG
jgi:hypothetical protein